MILDRSLEDRWPYFAHKNTIRLNTLQRLADGGFFKNNRQMIVEWYWPCIHRFCQVLRSMTDLEKLRLLKWELKLTEDLPKLFRSCPKLTELHLKLVESRKLEMSECLKNKLRPGFQRLRLVELDWEIDSWPVIQEMFT